MPQLIAPPTPTEWDLQHLKACDPSVRFRRLVELAIVRKLVTDVIAAGHSITVYDGEDRPVKRSKDVDLIMDHAFSVDECWLNIRALRDSGVLGTVLLVYGNSGWDVISDYHISLENLLKPVNEYAEQLSDWF